MGELQMVSWVWKGFGYLKAMYYVRRIWQGLEREEMTVKPLHNQIMLVAESDLERSLLESWRLGYSPIHGMGTKEGGKVGYQDLVITFQPNVKWDVEVSDGSPTKGPPTCDA